MSDAKPTPGPWRIDERFPGSYAIEPDIAWLGASSSQAPGENLANAQLMAAAPDLYAALRVAKTYGYKTGMHIPFPREWEQINKALSKAKKQL